MSLQQKNILSEVRFKASVTKRYAELLNRVRACMAREGLETTRALNERVPFVSTMGIWRFLNQKNLNINLETFVALEAWCELVEEKRKIKK